MEADGPDTAISDTAPGVVGPAGLAVQDGMAAEFLPRLEARHTLSSGPIVLICRCGTCQDFTADSPKSITTVESGHGSGFQVDCDLAEAGSFWSSQAYLAVIVGS